MSMLNTSDATSYEFGYSNNARPQFPAPFRKRVSEPSSSLEGSLTRFRYGAGNWGLALFEYPNSYDVASEVFNMDMTTKKNTRVYGDKSRAVRDFALLPGGDVILVAVERQGKSNDLPI